MDAAVKENTFTVFQGYALGSLMGRVAKALGTDEDRGGLKKTKLGS